MQSSRNCTIDHILYLGGYGAVALLRLDHLRGPSQAPVGRDLVALPSACLQLEGLGALDWSEVRACRPSVRCRDHGCLRFRLPRPIQRCVLRVITCVGGRMRSTTSGEEFSGDYRAIHATGCSTPLQTQTCCACHDGACQPQVRRIETAN